MTLRSIRNSLGENRRMFFATRRELGNAWTREKTGGWGERETGGDEGAVKYAGNLVMLQENTHTSSIAPPINLMNRA